MKVVFITGKQGAGKSWTAEHFKRSKLAGRIDVDKVLKAGAKELPASQETPTSWRRWEENSGPCLSGILARALTDKYGSLARKNKTLKDKALIVEGAIICNEWFLEPLIEALVKTFQLGSPSFHFIYVNAPDCLLVSNIRERGRPGERELFRDVASTADYHRGFDNAIREAISGGRQWVSCADSDGAIAETGRILDG